MGRSQTNTWEDAAVIKHHVHPDLSETTPNGRLRVGAITFGAASSNTQTLTLGKAGGASRIYTFKDVLGAAPAAGNVSILTQSTAILTAQVLQAAIAGSSVPGIILYSAGEGAHPDFVAAYTHIRVSIGAVLHPATGVGPTLVFIAKFGDSAAVCTLSDTLTHGGIYLLTAITRIYSQRYTMTGNAAALIDRIAGAYQCVVPMNSVWHPTELVLVPYDVGKVVVEATSTADATIIECDGYCSADEVTFTPLFYGLELSREEATKGCQAFLVSTDRVPQGSGFYVRMRSNGTNVADYVEFKVQYHLYPSDLEDE
jgi:hypothetical protein